MRQMAVLACSMLLLAACAAPSGLSQAEAVKARAMARWDVLLSGDLAGAYAFLSPATRTSVSSLQYQRSVLLQKVQWTKAEYVSETCEETTCNVKISVDFVIRGALPGVRSFADTELVEETWLLTDGDWYFIPQN